MTKKSLDDLYGERISTMIMSVISQVIAGRNHLFDRRLTESAPVCRSGLAPLHMILRDRSNDTNTSKGRIVSLTGLVLQSLPLILISDIRGGLTADGSVFAVFFAVAFVVAEVGLVGIGAEIPIVVVVVVVATVGFRTHDVALLRVSDV